MLPGSAVRARPRLAEQAVWPIARMPDTAGRARSPSHFGYCRPNPASGALASSPGRPFVAPIIRADQPELGLRSRRIRLDPAAHERPNALPVAARAPSSPKHSMEAIKQPCRGAIGSRDARAPLPSPAAARPPVAAPPACLRRQQALILPARLWPCGNSAADRASGCSHTEAGYDASLGCRLGPRRARSPAVHLPTACLCCVRAAW